jgi:arginase family enzyme
LVSRISVVGVPSSAASYAAGQDLAPAALRSAGLLEQLIACGLEVHDDGDLPHQAWSPDRDHPLAQNAGQATTPVQQLADRLGPLLARGDIALVLGGNCTIALGIMAALRYLGAGPPGLLYVDRHYDLNTPESTTDGALDWMGLAHALALPGCLDTLTGAFGPREPALGRVRRHSRARRARKRPILDSGEFVAHTTVLLRTRSACAARQPADPSHGSRQIRTFGISTRRSTGRMPPGMMLPLPVTVGSPGFRCLQDV